jgi:hypothetical protein
MTHRAVAQVSGSVQLAVRLCRILYCQTPYPQALTSAMIPYSDTSLKVVQERLLTFSVWFVAERRKIRLLS